MLKIEGLHDNGPEGSNDGLLDDAMQSGLRTGRKFNDGQLTITRLTSGVKDVNRVNVFVNEKFALSLDVRQAVDLRVKVGRVINADFLRELHEASEFGKLYQRALEWALMRPRSVWETRDYLRRRQIKRSQLNRKRTCEELKPLPEIQTSAMELVVERLTEKGYVDDRRFAEYYIENRFVKKGVSQKRLRQELSKKGVSDAVISEVFENTARSDEDELAKIIAKKVRKYERQKLIAYLVRQGFSYQDVCEAVEKYEAENAESPD